MLREDRGAVQRSHAKGERRKEADELLHLQLLARPLRGSNRPRAAGSRVLCDVLTPLGFVPSSAQDLALLAQADVLGGVFASTFVKSALQLGAASAYVSLDTFPWCPLLRCYWFWRDLCHNCEVCANQAGGGEACTGRGYHTALGLRHVLQVSTTRPLALAPTTDPRPHPHPSPSPHPHPSSVP